METLLLPCPVCVLTVHPVCVFVHGPPISYKQCCCWCSQISVFYISNTHTHTHTRLMALCPGLPRWAGTKKEKPIWILLKQETVSGSGIRWAICKSAPRSRQIPHQHLTAQFFTGWMPFLPPNQQRQSTEGNVFLTFFLNMKEMFSDRCRRFFINQMCSAYQP